MSNNIICTMPWFSNAIPALQKVKKKGNFSLVQEEASSRTTCKIHSLALILQVAMAISSRLGQNTLSASFIFVISDSAFPS